MASGLADLSYLSSQPLIETSTTLQQIPLYALTQSQRFVMFVCLISLIIIVGFGLIGIVLMMQIKPKSHHPQIPIFVDPDFEDQTVGASTNGVVTLRNGQDLSHDICDTKDQSQWIGGRCQCIPPFYGPTCSLESWDDRFYSLGTPDTNVEFTAMEVSDSSVKTWDLGGQLDLNSCSEIANRHSEAIGFKFEDGICEILTHDLKITGLITYNPLDPGTMYIKRQFKPKVSGKVFVSTQGNPALRYYATRRNTSSFGTIPHSLVTVVGLQPHTIYNFDGAIGIWSPHPFKLEDFEALRSSGTVFVDLKHGVYTITIPSSLRSDHYYVAYKI